MLDGDSGARNVPPSRARLAAAASAGIFSRSRMLSAGLVLVVAGSLAIPAGPLLGASLAELMRNGLERAFALRTESGAAVATLLQAGRLLAWIAAPLLVVALAAVSIPAWIARRRGGQTAAPLPRVRERDLFSGALSIAAAAAIVMIAVWILRRAAGPALERAGAGSEAALGSLAAPFAVLLVASGAILCIAGLAEMAWYRARIWRALHLDAAQARREAREQGGDERARRRMRERESSR
ncbi:MAG: EscU/YscU/HrcU family type III secretion system export apparatus switch protein [Polyangia bacterium]